MTNKKTEIASGRAPTGAAESAVGIGENDAGAVPAIPDDLLTFRIQVLSQLLGRVVEASVSENLGLSARQWRFLMTLTRIGTATSGDIAQFSHLDYSQVSRAGAELLEKGLVAYATDRKDRRKSYVSITAKGRRIVDKGMSRAIGRQRRLRDALDADEYRMLSSALRKLTDQAGAMLAELRTMDDSA